jgi:hypothetical protein
VHLFGYLKRDMNVTPLTVYVILINDKKPTKFNSTHVVLI